MSDRCYRFTAVIPTFKSCKKVNLKRIRKRGCDGFVTVSVRGYSRISEKYSLKFFFKILKRDEMLCVMWLIFVG